MEHCDVAVIGAGAAGMMCAIEAGKRGRRVVLLDHAQKIGLKILISGGGRCNFTNTETAPEAYVSANPHFCKSALSRFTPDDFIAMVRARGIAYHEKKLGQLFCDKSAKDIVELLVHACEEAGAAFRLHTQIRAVHKDGTGFRVETSRGPLHAVSVVVATGGLSLPKTGATGLGYRIAREFGLEVVPTTPALDGFYFAPDLQKQMGELAGVSADALVSCNGAVFRENILFTHAGISGPAALQASLYWRPGDAVLIDAAPGTDLPEWFRQMRRDNARTGIKNLLSELMPRRLAERFCDVHLPGARPLGQTSDAELDAFCARIQPWKIVPSGTVGYAKAEVTRGGVSTGELSSKTMEAKKAPGLYFVGEVVDVTGRLGGFNFQWAWASGWVAGQYA